MTALLVDASTPTGTPAPARRRGGGLWAAVRGSRKALVGLGIFLVFSVMAAVPQLFTPVRDPNELAFPPALSPSRQHPLGTTTLGQDIFAQLVYGTRQSLVIALVAGFFATVLAVLIGVSAAYLGGFTDDVLSMVTNVFLVIPTFPLIIILATYAGKGTLLVVLIVLVVTGWSYGANQLRAQTLSLRNRDFLESARVRGERRSYIIVVEMLPTMTSLIVASFLGAALYSVLTAAGPAVPRPRRPQLDQLGHDALLGAEPAGAADRPAAVVDRARSLRRAARGLLRPAQLRLRRDQQPGAATGEEAACPPYPCLRSGTSGSSTRPRAAPSPPSLDVDLDVREGEFVGVVGESGCGKSTLLFAIAQLLSPPAAITAGSVVFRGQNLVAMTERQLQALRWRDFSVVMQSAMNALNPVTSIGAQFKDAMAAHGTMPARQATERSVEVLRLVGIDPVHLAATRTSSRGGMRQRAMIAMALLFTPDLVIMDEPTSALDVVAQRSLMVQIKELQQRLGFAVVFVTHDMSLVSHFSDRLLVMYAGQVVESGPTRTVFDTPAHPYSRGLLDAFPSIRGPRVPLTGIPGSPPDLAQPPAGCRFHPRCPVAFADCDRVGPGAVPGGRRPRALPAARAAPGRWPTRPATPRRCDT